MAFYPATSFVPQFFTDAGVPLSGGTLSAFIDGSSTPTPMYIDSAGTSAGAVITLNARGEPQVSNNTVIIWLDAAINYKFVMADASAVNKWTITGIANLSFLLSDSSNVEHGDALVAVKRTLTGAITQTLHDWIEGQPVHISEFGVAGTGSNEQAAINTAFAWLNGADGRSLVFDAGKTYLASSGFPAITRNKASLICDGGCFLSSGNSTSTITLGATGNQIVDFSARGIGFVYSGTPTNVISVNVISAARTEFSDIELVNTWEFCRLGSSLTDTCAVFTISRVRGYVNNSGAATFNLRYGAGFLASDIQLYVPVDFPVYPDSLDTVVGTRFVDCSTSGWDTIRISDILAERFDAGVYLAAITWVIGNVWIDNCIFDLCKSYGMSSFADTGGSVIGIHCSNTWFTAWDGTGIYIAGSGNNQLHEFANSRVFLTANGGIDVAGAAKYLTFTGMQVYANNKAANNSDCVSFAAGVSNFSWSGGEIGADTTAVGLPYSGRYGIAIGVDVDNYVITGANVRGATTNFIANGNSAGSTKRLIRNNIGSDYAGVKTGGIYTLPATNVAWTNTTPYAHEIHINSGTVSGIQKNGTNVTGMTMGQLTIEPGESFTITYSSAPSVTWFALK